MSSEQDISMESIPSPSKMDKVKEILKRPEFSVLDSPTKKIMKYQDEEKRRGYPRVNIKEVCKLLGCNPSTYYNRKKSYREGFPSRKRGRHPVLNPEESEELYEMIKERADQGQCMTRKEVLAAANELRRRRCGDEENSSICMRTISNWMRNHKLSGHDASTMLKVSALSNRPIIAHMYEVLHKMISLYNYPDSLIFNMDETWANTELTVSNQQLVDTPDTRPIALQSREGEHITLIGCISKSAEVVRTAYIVPKDLRSRKLITQYHLEYVKTYQQESGLMTGEILARWIREVLGPHVDSRREYPGQHALLICESHVSQWMDNVRQALFDNRIDMIVLPPLVASVFQPLDQFVLKTFKDAFRENIKRASNGGEYSMIALAEDSFRIATTKQRIDDSWKQSRLFTEDVQSVLSEFDDVNSDSPDSKGCEVITCTMNTEVWTRLFNII